MDNNARRSVFQFGTCNDLAEWADLETSGPRFANAL